MSVKIPNKVVKYDKRQQSNLEWQAARTAWVGASEIGTILRINDYESPLEMYHRKVGVISSTKPETLSTYSGHVMEPIIYNHYWKFYDPRNATNDQLVLNAEHKTVIRTAERVDFTLVNPKYPWLSCSLDYAIHPNAITPPGPLDCKNSLQWVMKQYEGDVHPNYIAQMNQQLLITGWEYAELCFLQDGRYPMVYSLPANPTIQQSILDHSSDFWQRVEKGRLIWNKFEVPEFERLQQLVEFEPEVDESSALEQYLKERYKASGKKGRMIGTPEILSVCKEYLTCTEQMNEIEKGKTLQGNLLRKLFLDAGIDEIMFNDRSMITYRNVEGKATLRVSKDLLKM